MVLNLTIFCENERSVSSRIPFVGQTEAVGNLIVVPFGESGSGQEGEDVSCGLRKLMGRAANANATICFRFAPCLLMQGLPLQAPATLGFCVGS